MLALAGPNHDAHNDYPHRIEEGSVSRKASVTNHRAVLSQDGAVRMTESLLRKTPLQHIISGLYEDPMTCGIGIGIGAGATVTCLDGYTEWVSETYPQITLGWDWGWQFVSGRSGYRRREAPFSNITLVDQDGRDIGVADTARLLGDVIDQRDWQDIVGAYLATHYR